METVVGPHRPDPTGLFFSEQNEDAIIDAVDTFERNRCAFTRDACVANAARFSERRFRDAFSGFVDQVLADSLAGQGRPYETPRPREASRDVAPPSFVEASMAHPRL
jgi:hypothetical protein